VSELWELTATELLAAFESREARPTEAVESCLTRIDAIDGDVNAVLITCGEGARTAAAESDARWTTGRARPLEGVPFGLKDIIATAGVPTTGGSSIYRDYVPAESACLASRLTDAGGVLLAKLQTYEFAFGGEINTHYGPMRNPFDLARATGGSSGGSGGAVAAREMPLAIGTDTGGSIRIPAAYCGITGLKPTYGRVPRHGVMGLAWTLDHAGPMARSVDDVALMLGVIAGHDPRDPYAWDQEVPDYAADIAAGAGVTGVRVGVPTTWFFDRIHPEVQAACNDALDVLRSLGCVVVPVEVPGVELAERVGWTIMAAEQASYHEITFDRLDEYDERFAERLVGAQFITAHDYLSAQRLRSVVQQGMSDAFAHVDVLFTPGAVTTAPLLDGMLADLGDESVPWIDVVARCTFPFNVTGMPALVLPSGLDHNGLPMSIQLAARPFDETACLRVGRAFQQVTAHHLALPGLLSVA
jgi:aspartyl-tRNA(Asn)/glutamyl-tRNA(Gln) amidotransferase subunit A